VIDKAQGLLERVIPPPSDEVVRRMMKAGIEHGLRNGVTQAHSMGLDWDTHNALLRLRKEGETDMRFFSFVPLSDWEKLADIIKRDGRGDDWVRWGGLKGLADGSLGSRTALFYEPYDDQPGTHGIRVNTLEHLREWVTQADRHNMNVSIHAIGDEANDDVLDLYEAVAKANGPRDRRFRIEHAQHLTQAAIARFARQNVIASVQPYHAIDGDSANWSRASEGHLRIQVADRYASACLFWLRLAGGAVRALDRYCGGGAAADYRWEKLRRLDAGAAHHGRAGAGGLYGPECLCRIPGGPPGAPGAGVYCRPGGVG
jgi:hypothetical protein